MTDYSVLERAARQASEYKLEFSDVVIKDHCEAMACLNFEAHLRAGLSLYEYLLWLDRRWHSMLHRGQTEYDQHAEELLRKAFAEWYGPCDSAIKALDYFEGKGFEIADGDAFRTACREVAGILTEDEEFFDGEALRKAEREAIESLHRGDCEPM